MKCNKCNNSEVSYGVTSTGFVIVCDKCGDRGPEASTVTEAMQLYGQQKEHLGELKD